MTTNDNRPWAFDGNEAWEKFRKQAEERGIRLKPLWSCYSSDDPNSLPTRGHNIRAFVVLPPMPEGSVQLSMLAVAMGSGPDGYQFMIDPPTNSNS